MSGQINPIPHPIMVDLQKRVSRLEETGAERSTAVALVSQDVRELKEDVGSIKKGISKVLWTIVGAFLTTSVGIVTTFVLTGGLNLIN